jgi:lysophospholipase L1-like esterase
MRPISSRRAGGQRRSFRGLLRVMVAPLLLVSAFSVSAFTGSTSAAAKTAAPPKGSPWYLSLGDSLAQGVQSDGAGGSIITDTGYVDDLYNSGLAARPHLQLMKLGCPGETSSSMVLGAGATPPSPCTYAEGSQLAAAAAFIATHRVAFITMDIGANDVDGCITAINPQACVVAALPVMAQNVGLTVGTLEAAIAGSGQKTRIFGMNYYDPFLAAWLTGPAGQVQAQQTEVLTEALNITLQGVYSHFAVRVANVQLAYQTSNFDIVPPIGVPVNVLEICINTWMCSQGNIHANDIGYQVIADAFLKLSAVL